MLVDGTVVLKHTEGVVDVVLDTDAFNEVDDQFAIAYALFSSERIQLQAIYAAPFLNARVGSAEEGMEQSYDEILHIMRLCEVDGIPVFRGARRFMGIGPVMVPSEAVDDLVRRAMQHSRENPLYVVAIGAPTNIASAVLSEPEILDRIVVLWLGGHSFDSKDTQEFNMEQDPAASQVIINAPFRLVLFPCEGVTDKLRISTRKLKERLCSGSLSDYLVSIVEAYDEKEFGDEKVIWDIIPFAWLFHQNAVTVEQMAIPELTGDFHWNRAVTGKQILCATDVDREIVFDDLFDKIAGK